MVIDWTYFYIVASGHFCTPVLVPCCTFLLEHLRYDNWYRADKIISIYIYILDINNFKLTFAFLFWHISAALHGDICTFFSGHIYEDMNKIRIWDPTSFIDILLHFCVGTFLHSCFGTFVHFSFGTSKKIKMNLLCVNKFIMAKLEHPYFYTVVLEQFCIPFSVPFGISLEEHFCTSSWGHFYIVPSEHLKIM